MPLITQEFVTTPGMHTFSNPDIYAVRLLGVSREGLGQTLISSSGPIPVDREFSYLGGTLTFSNLLPFNPGEKINVLYEI